MAERVRFCFDPVSPRCHQTSTPAHRYEQLGTVHRDARELRSVRQWRGARIQREAP